jgi:hypothetical protein
VCIILVACWIAHHLNDVNCWAIRLQQCSHGSALRPNISK